MSEIMNPIDLKAPADLTPRPINCAGCGAKVLYRIRYNLCSRCLVPGSAKQEKALAADRRKVLKERKDGKR